MRYPAGEKLEIIRLVEQSPLPVRAPWPNSAFPRQLYRWYDRYRSGGPEALNDRRRGRIGYGTASGWRA